MVTGQRLEVEPVDVEGVQRVAGGSQRFGASLVDGAQEANFHHYPKIEIIFLIADNNYL